MAKDEERHKWLLTQKRSVGRYVGKYAQVNIWIGLGVLVIWWVDDDEDS
jgi:hypothetical protein